MAYCSCGAFARARAAPFLSRYTWARMRSRCCAGCSRRATRRSLRARADRVEYATKRAVPKAFVHGHSDADGIIDMKRMLSRCRRWMTSAASSRGRPTRRSARRRARCVQPHAGLVRRRRPAAVWCQRRSCELPNVRTLRMTLPQGKIRRWDAETGTRSCPPKLTISRSLGGYLDCTRST